MKMGAAYVLAVALLMPETAVLGGEPASPDECVVQYFEASKNGDIGRMKQLIAGSFYDQRKTLLEKNTTYPAFLRKYYDDAHLQITNVREDPGGWVVELRIKFADGTVDSSKFLLRKDASGTWKIVQNLNT